MLPGSDGKASRVEASELQASPKRADRGPRSNEAIAKAEPRSRLRFAGDYLGGDNRNKARVDDALIRGDESKPPHAGSRHNRPVSGIPQRSAECCDLSGNLRREGHYLKSRIGIDLARKLIERDIASRTAFAKQNRDLKQSDCAERNGLMPANGIPQNAFLLPRKLFGRCEPANGYMRVEKKARIQRRAPLR
jgi:hypothetical protein